MSMIPPPSCWRIFADVIFRRGFERLANAEERISMSFSDTLITVNESMRRRLSAISSRPVSVVMNIPDPGLFAPLEASRDRGSFEWIVYSGTIAHRNGLDLVVQGGFPAG